MLLLLPPTHNLALSTSDTNFPTRIVLGSLNGDLEPAFKKLKTLHSKNSFALAILTGDVFAPTSDDATIDALFDGSLEVPLPTYFTVGTQPLPPRIASKIEADEEICPNLHYLGKRSVTKTSEGMRIVALGGLPDPNGGGGGGGGSALSQDQHLPFHTEIDAKTLKGNNSADIVLTTTWPKDIWAGSKVALEPAQQAAITSSAAIGELCAALRPRYHFSASPGPFFYEREPFVHPSEKETDPTSVSRFISMAPFGNDAKAKAMYAFTLSSPDTLLPPGTTPSPFAPKPKKRSADDDQYSRFGNQGQYDDGYSRRRKKRRASPPPGPDRCFFCLSNPNLATHMCCCIGDDAYVTVAKGPLPTSSTFAEQGLDFPGHLIIIPLPHTPLITALGDPSDPASEAVKTSKEMTRFRDAIQAMVAARSSHKLGVVTWEISRARNVHVIWQLVPVPADLIRNGLAEAGFKVEAENQKLPAFVTRDLSLEEQAGFGDFFRVWLWADDGEDKIKGKSLVMPLPTDTRFDLQFGRRVLAKLMGLEDRLIWQDCAQSVEEETQNVESFREAFKEWDFTLES